MRRRMTSSSTSREGCATGICDYGCKHKLMSTNHVIANVVGSSSNRRASSDSPDAISYDEFKAEYSGVYFKRAGMLVAVDDVVATTVFETDTGVAGSMEALKCIPTDACTGKSKGQRACDIIGRSKRTY